MRFNYRVAALAALLTISVVRAADPTLVVINGRIWTGDPKQPWAEALAISGDRITAVGSSARITALIGPDTRVVNARRRLVTPGFNDAHIHFLSGAIHMTQADLTGAKNVAEIKRRIHAWAEAHPAAPWIIGGGWQYTAFPNGLPDRAMLDEVTGGRPAFLSAYDGHTGWANSAALERAGIRKGFEYKGFGGVDLDSAGEPTGVFKEHAQRLVTRLIPETTDDDDVEALREAMKMAARLGITSIQNASGGMQLATLYKRLLERDELTVRVGIAASIGPQSKPEVVDRIRKLAHEYHSNMLRVNAVKFVIDGVIEGHTAAMLEPYDNAPQTSGDSSWSPEAYKKMVVLADKAGLQILTHAIGDRAVRMALDAYENMFRVNGRRDARPRVEHIETISPEDIPRFGRLGVLASFQPNHADPSTSAVWTEAIGSARASRGFAWRSIQRSGGQLVFSSDWPASISVDPILGIYTAVTRQTVNGKPRGGWFPEERISIGAALRAYTVAGAYSSFEEKDKGTLSPGKLADFVILSKDLFRIPPRQIHTARVLLTVMGGRVMYSELRERPGPAESVRIYDAPGRKLSERAKAIPNGLKAAGSASMAGARKLMRRPQPAESASSATRLAASGY